jgi:hypothetical protein
MCVVCSIGAQYICISLQLSHTSCRLGQMNELTVRAAVINVHQLKNICTFNRAAKDVVYPELYLCM